jgi:membrane associated rhomboid family serine protease
VENIMVPVKIDEHGGRFPAATASLIVVCILVFIRQPPAGAPGGLVPIEFVYTILHPGSGCINSFINLLSSFFLHGGLLHLAGNMWYLWLFGGALEKLTGSLRCVVLFLLFGTVAMLTQVAADPFSRIPIVGASGAIAGLMGTYLVMKPGARIIFWFPPIFFFKSWAFLFLLFWFFLQWRSVHGAPDGEHLVAWWAHIGGFIAGVAYGFHLRLSKGNRGKRGWRSRGGRP